MSGFTEGGYQDGKHYFQAWDGDWNEIIYQELRAVTEQIAITSTGKFAALHTGEVIDEYRSGSRPEDAYDFSIYFIDLENSQITARYTRQIPGIKTGGGSRNMQIWDIEFVVDDSAYLLALFENREESSKFNKPVARDAVSDATPLVDMHGKLIQFGRPNINNHPDHYYLTAEAKERLNK
jgi:hypothetical protein